MATQFSTIDGLKRAAKGIKIEWGYYFKVGVVMTFPVLLVTLAALAIRPSAA
jgi:arsenical pump membrane protein